MEVWLLLLLGGTPVVLESFLIYKCWGERGRGGEKTVLKGIRVSGLNEVIWKELLSLLSEMNWIKSPNQSLSLLHSTLTAAQLQIIRWEETFNCGIREGERICWIRRGGEKIPGRVSLPIKWNQKDLLEA